MIDQRLNVDMSYLGSLRRMYHTDNVLRHVWPVSELLLSSVLAAEENVARAIPQDGMTQTD
jgi:hypothetical protein